MSCHYFSPKREIHKRREVESHEINNCMPGRPVDIKRDLGKKDLTANIFDSIKDSKLRVAYVTRYGEFIFHFNNNHFNVP